MQRDENLVYINNGVNGQQIDAIHMGYRQTGAVYTRWSGSVQIHPDRPPISVRARSGSNSNPAWCNALITCSELALNYMQASQLRCLQCDRL